MSTKETIISISHHDSGKYETGTPNGLKVFSVLINGCAATRESQDEQFVRQYARATYHATRGPKRIVDWDGDTQMESLIEACA